MTIEVVVERQAEAREGIANCRLGSNARQLRGLLRGSDDARREERIETTESAHAATCFFHIRGSLATWITFVAAERIRFWPIGTKMRTGAMRGCACLSCSGDSNQLQ